MSGLASLQSSHSFISLAAAQSQAAAAAAAALGGYGKIMQVNGTGAHMGTNAGGVPLLTSYRYSPYQLPTALTTNQAAQQAQVAALIAQHQYQAQQSLQDPVASSQPAASGQQQASQGVQQSLAPNIGASLNLGSAAAIQAAGQASHLTSVLPSVTISSATTNLTSPAVASHSGNLAVAAAKYAASVSGQGSINPNPFQVNGFLQMVMVIVNCIPSLLGNLFTKTCFNVVNVRD